MKLVIQTQIRENYAAHNGFNGEYYWKMKGGNTYVVRNLDARQAERARGGIPTLQKLIEEKNDYFEEYVLGFEVVEDNGYECEEWETPIEFYWVGDRWYARRTIENDEYGYMRKDILRSHESWIPLEGGERGHYKCEYQIVNGEWVDHKHLEKVLEEA
jgi:hypothetical protein